jgi:hypothetical protein
MISPAWEIGGYIGQLSRVAQPWSSRERFFAMLNMAAYWDESESAHQVYCVAGYWAAARDWEQFENLWRAELDCRGIREFHAVDCEHGHGEFEGRTDRPEMQRRFIEIIRQSRIRGVFAPVNMRAWDEHAARLEELQAAHEMKGPYYVAFQLALEVLGGWLKPFPAQERIAVAFDRRPKQGQVEKLYNSIKDATDPAFDHIVGRLGPLIRDDPADLLGLQAADLLAYEVKRQFAVEWGLDARPVRWQWQELMRSSHTGRQMSEEHVPQLLAQMETQWGEAARLRRGALEERRADRAARGAAASHARRSPSAP